MIDLKAIEKRAHWLRENLESPTATQTADDVDVLIAEVQRLEEKENYLRAEWKNALRERDEACEVREDFMRCYAQVQMLCQYWAEEDVWTGTVSERLTKLVDHVKQLWKERDEAREEAHKANVYATESDEERCDWEYLARRLAKALTFYADDNDVELLAEAREKLGPLDGDEE